MLDSPSFGHDVGRSTAASENEPIHLNKSPRETIPYDIDEDDMPLIILYRARRKQHAHSCSKQSPNLLKILPLELIFLILDFMTPDEYSGFTCTCRDALSLVNQKLVASEPCYPYGLIPWTSRTGDYIRIQQRIRESLQEIEIGPSCVFPNINYDEDDADL
jgi:hypothetical protein